MEAGLLPLACSSALLAEPPSLGTALALWCRATARGVWLWGLEALTFG